MWLSPWGMRVYLLGFKFSVRFQCMGTVGIINECSLVHNALLTDNANANQGSLANR